MKVYFFKIILQLFLIFGTNLNLNSKPSFTPFLINFNGVIAEDNKIIAFGDYGSILIGFDDGKIWEQRRLFENGNIKKSFYINSKFYFICEDGQVSVWDNNLELELNYKKLNLTNLHSFIYNNNSFYFRGIDKLVKVGLDLKITKSVDMYLFNTEILHNRYISELKGNIYATINDFKIIKFDENLNVIDTHLIYDTLPNFPYTSYWLHSDGDYLYFYLGNSIFKTKDFKSFQKVIDGLGELLIPIELKDELLLFGKQSTYNSNIIFYSNVINSNGKYDSLGIKYSVDTRNGKLRDRSLLTSAIKYKNKLIIVGVSKFIVIADLDEKNKIVFNKVVSEMTNFTPFKAELPFFHNNEIILLSGEKNDYNKFINISYDGGTTFQALIDTSVLENKVFATLTYLKSIDIVNDTLYMFGRSSVKIYKDSNLKVDKDILYKSTLNNDTILNTITDEKLNNDVFDIVDFTKFNNYYFYIRKYKDIIQELLILDNNLVIKNKINLVGFNVKNILILDSNKYLIICSDFSNQNLSILSSVNEGNNWENIFNKENSKIINSNLLKINNEDYFAIVYHNFFTNKLYFELFNINTFETLQLHTLDLTDENIDNIYNAKIFYNSWTYYLSVGSRIYYLNTEKLGSKAWQYYEFEDNGVILSDLKIKDKNIYVLYKDDIHKLH